MQKSETIGKLTEALNKAQSEIKGAVKDSNNPFFKASYADLSSVWDACRGPLTQNGLAVIQTTDTAEQGVIVETILSHTSGEWISGRLQMNPTKNDPQGVGSAITYARRYALAAIVGVCPEDDDGEGAMGRKVEKKNGASNPGSPVSKQEAPAPSPESPAPPDTKTKNYDFMKAMKTQKDRVGETAYYLVLGTNGIEHANEIVDREQQKKIFRELSALDDAKGVA